MQLTLEEFEKKLREDMDRFGDMYRKGQRTQPDAFAVTMEEGDWYEQFVMFND